MIPADGPEESSQDLIMRDVVDEARHGSLSSIFDIEVLGEVGQILWVS